MWENFLLNRLNLINWRVLNDLFDYQMIYPICFNVNEFLFSHVVVCKYLMRKNIFFQKKKTWNSTNYVLIKKWQNYMFEGH